MKTSKLTARQSEILEAYIKHGSQRKAAKALGVSKTSVHKTVRACEKKGLVPWLENSPIPAHMRMTNTTVHYKGGKVEQEWRRLVPNVQEMEEFVEGLCDQASGKGKAPKRPSRKSDTGELLFELDIFDPHVGMFADELETLDKGYDCAIASHRMMEATEDLCSRVEPFRPKKAVVCFGGDLLHSDTRSNQTEKSKHVLDVDSRYDRVSDYAETICKDVIARAAKVAEEVEIIVVEGNHDWHSCKWMARVLRAYFRNCSNITVNIQRSERKHITWGDNLLVWAHGDRIKPQSWQGIISTELARQWGKTKWRYLRLGHIHHQKSFSPIQVDEQTGLIVEYLPALAATDAWHASSGFIGNQKGASGFIYHKNLGLRDRLYHNVV